MGLSLEKYTHQNISEAKTKRQQSHYYLHPDCLRLESCILKKKATFGTRQIECVQKYSSKTPF